MRIWISSTYHVLVDTILDIRTSLSTTKGLFGTASRAASGVVLEEALPNTSKKQLQRRSHRETRSLGRFRADKAEKTSFSHSLAAPSPVFPTFSLGVGPTGGRRD
jgi:hypothetical protein